MDTVTFSEMEENLAQERSGDYRVITLTGTHAEIGMYLGKDAHIEPTLLALQCVANQNMRAFDLACKHVVQEYHPGLTEEIGGWAEAKGIQEDLAYRFFTVGITLPHRPMCSSFAYRANGQMIAGRNYDYYYEVKPRYLMQTYVDGYYSSIGMNDGLLAGRCDGMNEWGLVVFVNSVKMTRPPRPRPGVQYYLIPRILLETCKTATEARNKILQMPHLSAAIFLIVDANQLFIVEAHPDKVMLREPESSYGIATNHFMLPDLAPLNGAQIYSNSLQRSQRLSSLLGSIDSSNPYVFGKTVLRDHEGPLCGHQEGLATLWACIARVTDRRIAYTFGAPCRNQFVEFSAWPHCPKE